MPFVKAMCTNCGGILQVDESKEAAVCPFCSTPYIVEKAINNYQINNQFSMENSNVYISNGISAEKKLENAEAILSVHHDCEKAERLFKEVSEMLPMDYRAWWGIVRAQTAGFTYFGFDNDELDDVREYMKSAIRVAGDKKDALIKRWDQYMSDYNTLIDLDVRRKLLKEKMYMTKLDKEFDFNSVHIIISAILILFGILVIPTSIKNGKGKEGAIAAVILFVISGMIIANIIRGEKG